MAITGYSSTRIGTTTVVTATSDLSGTVYYHWYIDGAWLGQTTSPSYSLNLPAGEQGELVCQDTTDPAYDYLANAPAGFPSRRTLFWTASTSPDISHYRIEQKQDAGGWAAVGTVRHVAGQWTYRFTTATLSDGSTYQWRVVAVDRAGNEQYRSGGYYPLAEAICCRPAAPDWAGTYSPGTQRITIAAA